MDRRITNIACVLIGIVTVFVSLRLLLHHQYSISHRNFFSDAPERWVSTFVPFLGGIWIFLFGLVGLVGDAREKGTQSE
jgi:uncharacterized membrane protein